MRKLNPKNDVSRQFFDWLFMGEALGVAELFRNNLEFSLENFYSHETKRGFIPRDCKSGMAFLHDFETGYYSSARECQLVITKGWENFSAKYIYLRKKFVRLVREVEDIAFIYYGNMNLTELNSLQDAVVEFFQNEIPIFNFVDKTDSNRVSSASNELVFVNKKPREKSVAPWKGDDLSWDSALEKVAARMTEQR